MTTAIIEPQESTAAAEPAVAESTVADESAPVAAPQPPALDTHDLTRLGEWFQWVPEFAVTRGDADVLQKLDANAVAQMPDEYAPAVHSRFGPQLRLIRGGRHRTQPRTLEQSLDAMIADALDAAPTAPPVLRIVRHHDHRERA